MEQRRKLEHDLERYAALLRLVTDDRAIAALKELIRETLARLRELDQLEDCFSASAVEPTASPVLVDRI